MHEADWFNEEEWDEIMEDFRKLAEKQLREDPFYNPKLRKHKKPKQEKKVKTFQGYNWTTHKKKLVGIRRTIKELKAKAKQRELTDAEKLKLNRMQSLRPWHEWALQMHEEGWSDKRIHAETLRRKQSKE